MKQIILLTALSGAVATISAGAGMAVEDDVAERMIGAGMAKEFKGTEGEWDDIFVETPQAQLEAANEKRAMTQAKAMAAAKAAQAERDKLAAGLPADREKARKAQKKSEGKTNAKGKKDAAALEAVAAQKQKDAEAKAAKDAKAKADADAKAAAKSDADAKAQAKAAAQAEEAEAKRLEQVEAENLTRQQNAEKQRAAAKAAKSEA